MPTETDKTQIMLAALDAFDAMPGAREMRARSYDLLRIEREDRVVDVGCGTGRAVAELSDLGARAIGIDPNEDTLEIARGRWPGREFKTGTAEELPFAGNELAGYRADKLYHALSDPGAALDEARRVLAPGGRILLAGQDWEVFVIDSGDPEFTRVMVQARAEQLPHPRIARGYRNLLLDHGFTDVTVEVHTAVFTDRAILPSLMESANAALEAGTATQAQVDAWIAEQTRRVEEDRFFLALPMFLAAGTCP